MGYDVNNVRSSLSSDLLVIVAGIELSWNVISGNVVSVKKKTYVLFTSG